MDNKQKADIIAWTHFIWMLFGFISLPMLFIISWWHKVVIFFIILTVISWIWFRDCWFTQLENRWRRQYNPNETIEEEAFLQHYLKKYLNIQVSMFSVRILIYSYLATLTWISIIQFF